MDINKYNQNLITRRTVVQFLYQHFFVPFESVEEVNENNNEFSLIYNKELFNLVMKLALKDEKKIKEALNEYNLTICAKGVIIAGYYDVCANEKDRNIIFNEYLQIAKSLCLNEKNIVHKILDKLLQK